MPSRLSVIKDYWLYYCFSKLSCKLCTKLSSTPLFYIVEMLLKLGLLFLTFSPSLWNFGLELELFLLALIVSAWLRFLPKFIETFFPVGVEDEGPMLDDYLLVPMFEFDVFLIKPVLFFTSYFYLGTLFYFYPKCNCYNFY